MRGRSSGPSGFDRHLDELEQPRWVTDNMSMPGCGKIFRLATLLLLLGPSGLPAFAGQSRSRTFELIYKATVRDIPEGAKALDLRLPVPQTDRNQTIVPVDASEAAQNPARRDYFFGHHDEDRLEFSRGRHLRLVPAQQGPPVEGSNGPRAL